MSSCCAWPWLRHSELTFYEFAHPPLIDLLHYCAITLMFITVMTLVIVILMIFFDILVKIRKLKNCNLDKKKIVDFGGRFFFLLSVSTKYEALWNFVITQNFLKAMSLCGLKTSELKILDCSGCCTTHLMLCFGNTEFNLKCIISRIWDTYELDLSIYTLGFS